MNTATAIILAAGSGSRYGANKLLVSIEGVPLLRITVEAALAARLGDTIVVTGHERELVKNALDDLPVRFAHNAEYRSGMGGSVGTGAMELSAGCEAAVVLLGDQPVEAEIIERLLDAGRSSGRPIVAPLYRGLRLHPVVFLAPVFDELRALRGHAGARVLIDADPSRVTTVEFDRDPPPDLDLPEEREELAASLLARGLLA